MESVYVHGPDLVDYTPVADTAAGTLVWISGECGQVTASVSAGQLGAARIGGVIRMPKPDGIAFDHKDKIAWFDIDTRELMSTSEAQEIPTGEADIRLVGKVVRETATHVDILLNAFTGTP